ncbi:GFA family protein [Undibacterium pigrum]|uniref:CENP-V/GFA domain-containing protein n=1 Tax=Undibacterium pigrum TaxID=401470 RepID=A0A318J610_9BURK|nr:GFA family protein [Undibacterium pigrum]PXX43299.1 hypothetical protein DFR42_104300 [Undibacterium pigrum]
MSESFEGQCQCGEVQYEVTGESLTLFTCHCQDCQRQSSSAFGMALWIRLGDMLLKTGEPKLWVRKMPSGREMECSFCPTCGTRLFHRLLGQTEIISIKPGTLNDTSSLQAVAHIWTRSAQPWLNLDQDCLQYADNPDDFQILFAAWKNRNLPDKTKK